MTGTPPPSEVSVLLQRASEGNATARRELAACLYRELHALAEGQLRRERPDHTLSASDLVSEAWARLMQHEQATWSCRREFFAYAGRLMRNVLVDHARARDAQKRGGRMQPVDFSVALDRLDERPLPPEMLLDLHAALEELERVDERLVRVVDLRIFSGLTLAETAEVLEVPLRTVHVDYHAALAWLRRRLGWEGGGPW